MRALLVPLLLGSFVSAQDPAAAGERLFDGSTLRGWRGDPAIWTVQDGAITGSSVGQKVAANTFLVLDGREVGDFVLTCEVRLTGDNNSGVQYRSRELPGPGFRVAGPQCDWHPAPEFTAMLYDEQGDGIVAKNGQMVQRRDGGARVLGAIARPIARPLDSWHRLRIVAMGGLCWHEVDGVVVTAIDDMRALAPRRGVLALQLHAGAPMTVAFRNLALQEFADAVAMAKVVAVPPAVAALRTLAGKPAAVETALPKWLWDRSAEAEEEVFFRRSFELAKDASAAQLVVSCDNHCRVYLNGEQVGSSDAWETPLRVDVTKHLRPGPNVLAVHGWNDGGPAGLAARLSWRMDGSDQELVTDATWRCSDDDPDGWNTPTFAGDGWEPATVLFPVGGRRAPWTGQVSFEAFAGGGDPFAEQLAVPFAEVEAIGVGDGASLPVRQLFAVPRTLGSWVSLAKAPNGDLYAGAQGGGLYRITPAKQLGEATTVVKVPVELGGAHGLLWAFDALYAVVNEQDPGLYRLRDSDGDGMLDQKELLQAFDGRGEHGPHSVVIAPDGEHLLVVAGNQTKLPPLAKSRVRTDWAEDRLLPRLDDPNPYWEGHSPPGGWVCQCDRDGKQFELLTCGFRNPYDLVVLPGGRVLTYDSDMEWDLGTPWYRPTRVLEVIPGVDYGWRIGSAKWPADYPECPPAWMDVGPGSPTGMARCGDGFVMLDWTFGVLYAQRGERVLPALRGAPWPVADIADGYVVTGGRGLPSRLLQIEPAVWTKLASAVGEMRKPPLEPRPLAAVPGMLHADATPELGAPPADATFRHANTELAKLVVLARTGSKADLPQLLARLGEQAFEWMSPDLRIAWLRAHALGLMRLGPANDEQRALVAQRLLPLFPTGNERVDQDLCELLAYVDAPGLLEKAVPLLAELRPSPVPAWASIQEGSDVYGSQYSGVIAAMAKSMPPIGQLAIADALRIVKHGWTLAQRRTYFTFLQQARTRKGGASYDGFVKRIVDAAFATCTPAEQRELAELVGAAKADAPAVVAPPPRGPGRDWQLADADALLAPGLDGADRARGHELFHAVGCARCHYFAGEGGNHGPDLTSLGNKFGPRDVLEAVLQPSAVVSDQYRGQVLTKKDGSSLFGYVQRTFHGDVEVYDVMPAEAKAELVRVPVVDVQKVEPAKLSPMPSDLVDALSADELRALLAFLLGRGKS